MSNPIPSALALDLSALVDGLVNDAVPVTNAFNGIEATTNELITALSNGSAGQFLNAVDASDVQWAHPPGYEIAYGQITSTVNITGLTSGTSTNVVGPGAATFDGGPVMCEFFCPRAHPPNGSLGDTLNLGLYEGSTLIAVICNVVTSNSAGGVGGDIPVLARFRFTPSAGSHTYAIRAWVPDTTGTPTIQAGTGTAGAASPAYVRFTKV